MARTSHSQAEPDLQRSHEVYNIIGDKVALGPGTREEWVELSYRWENDFETVLLSGDPLTPRFREGYEADYDRSSRESFRRDVGFMIYERATAKSIGVTGLRHIDLKVGVAELGVMIGSKEHWGKGIGTEATTLVLDYGFTILGLHNVMLETFAYNERAIRSYLKVGFREIGRRREAQRIGDRRYDTVFMDILRSEFHSPFKPVVAVP